MSWIIALLILSALIFFHELGHYSAAKFFGVYVEVFSIGFGKKLLLMDITTNAHDGIMLSNMLDKTEIMLKITEYLK